MVIFLDEFGVHIGSKTYIGEASQQDILDLGRLKYDGKVYHYPGGQYQLVKCSHRVFRVPIPGMSDRPRHFPFCEDDDENTSNGRSRPDNVQRARQRMQQIILSNDWNYFLTITFDDLKVDASNANLVMAKLQRWLHNQTQRTGIGYLLVPEYHKKYNRIHAHALIRGDLPIEHNGIYKVKGISKPVRDDTIRKYKIPKDRILYPVYNCPKWKYGFSTAIEVYGSPSRLANYVLKYITKQTDKIFGKSYWVSKNLKLYPDIELLNLPSEENFYNSPGKCYYQPLSSLSFKYINHLGDIIQDMTDDEEVL